MFDLSRAKFVDNYAEDATGGGKWATTQKYTVAVPAGKRWFFLAAYANRSAAATASAVIKNSASKIIYKLGDAASASGFWCIPDAVSQVNTLNPNNVIMNAGSFVEITFSAAQGSGAHAAFAVLEIDI